MSRFYLSVRENFDIVIHRLFIVFLYKNIKISKKFMLILGLGETIDQLAMTSSVCWYGHVLRSEDGHVLSRA